MSTAGRHRRETPPMSTTEPRGSAGSPVTTEPPPGRLRRGRAAKRAMRRRNTVERWPELDRGLPYLDLVDHEDLLRIHDASITLLEEVGIEFRDDESASLYEEPSLPDDVLAELDDCRARMMREIPAELA